MKGGTYWPEVLTQAITVVFMPLSPLIAAYTLCLPYSDLADGKETSFVCIEEHFFCVGLHSLGGGF